MEPGAEHRDFRGPGAPPVRPRRAFATLWRSLTPECPPVTERRQTRLSPALGPRLAGLAAAILFAGAGPGGAQEAPDTPGADTAFRDLTSVEQQSEDLLRELVAYETIGAKPEETRRAFEAMVEHLREAGFADEDIRLVNPEDGIYGLMVRYRGRGEGQPVLALAHLDVVPATPDAWAFPPFTLGVRDGYYLGRGTDDNKAGVVQILGNFMRLKREGWVPGRDLVAAITGDEETQMKMAAWFASEESGLLEAEYALNSDGGFGQLNADGEPMAFFAQTAEKVYQTWDLTASDVGGHSSVPGAENAIEDLARAITRLAQNPFPIRLDDNMRQVLRRAADLYPEPLRADMLAVAELEDPEAVAASDAAARLAAAGPEFNALLRTTCTPTMLRGGHAENALPRNATVTVNCRILPGVPVGEVKARIENLVADLGVELTSVYDAVESPASVMPEAFRDRFERLVRARWGEVPVIPLMSTGATDGLWFRNAGVPVYGVSGLFGKPGESRAHGLDEKIGIQAFHDSVAFWYDLLKTFGE